MRPLGPRTFFSVVGDGGRLVRKSNVFWSYLGRRRACVCDDVMKAGSRVSKMAGNFGGTLETLFSYYFGRIWEFDKIFFLHCVCL